MIEKKSLIAMITILLAGSLWGTLGVFVRIYNKCHLASMDIVTIRAISTTIFMVLFLLCYKRKLLKIHIKDLWCFLGTGIGSIVFFNYCYFRTIALTSMSVAAVLLYTAPAMVMILSKILFGEKLSGIKIISLGLTLVGCVLVTGVIGDADTLNAMGILVGLGSGLGYALYSIFSRFALKRGYHAFTISFYTFLVVMVSTLPFVDRRAVYYAVTCNRGMLGLFIVFGIVSTVLPYILYTFGLQHTDNGKASILASVEPLVATLIGAVVYHEKITVGGICGIILVIAAIVMCNIPLESKKQRAKKVVE